MTASLYKKSITEAAPQLSGQTVDGQYQQSQPPLLQVGLSAANTVKNGYDLAQSLGGSSIFPGVPEAPVILNGQAVTTGAAPSATAAATPSAGFGSMGTSVLGAAGAYGLYDNYKNDREGIRGYGQGIASGAALGASLGGLPGAVIGGIGGGLLKAGQDLFDSGKSNDQKNRDSARDLLKQMGVVDGPLKGNATLQTFGGDSLDIGLDGSKANFDVDFSNPIAAQAVALVNPLAAIVAQKSGAKKEQVAGWLANGIMQNNKDPNALTKEAQYLYRKFGVGPQELLDNLGQMHSQGQISKDEINAFVDSIKGISQNAQNLKLPNAS